MRQSRSVILEEQSSEMKEVCFCSYLVPNTNVFVFHPCMFCWSCMFRTVLIFVLLVLKSQGLFHIVLNRNIFQFPYCAKSARMRMTAVLILLASGDCVANTDHSRIVSPVSRGRFKSVNPTSSFKTKRKSTKHFWGKTKRYILMLCCIL